MSLTIEEHTPFLNKTNKPTDIEPSNCSKQIKNLWNRFKGVCRKAICCRDIPREQAQLKELPKNMTKHSFAIGSETQIKIQQLINNELLQRNKVESDESKERQIMPSKLRALFTAENQNVQVMEDWSRDDIKYIETLERKSLLNRFESLKRFLEKQKKLENKNGELGDGFNKLKSFQFPPQDDKDPSSAESIDDYWKRISKANPKLHIQKPFLEPDDSAVQPEIYPDKIQKPPSEPGETVSSSDKSL